MSWQLGAFAILAVALAAGFGWYERSRPDSRIVALVATLAAFAALGRIAFVAVPNVKPTTDIVLISGYALGAGPGFVVGALAGLTSNFFFGQGPWTPWQMAAWAGVGVTGAGVAVAARRRLGRLPMALLCGAVGFAFTAVQDLGDWVTYSDHSLAQLGVFVGKGIGFDAVHAAGCVGFALAFGPAFARSIGRFSMRLQIRWEAAAAAALALALASGIAGQPARAVSGPTTYLLAAQNGDGGYGAAPGQPSAELFSGWAALGLAASGIDPQRVVKDGHSLTGYIEASAGTATDAGSIERMILALRAAGLPAPVSVLERHIGANGSVSNQTNLTAFAILALRAAGVTPPARTTRWLARQHDADGGFNFLVAGGSSDIDDTGAALEALGAGSAVSARAVGFLERHQNRDGGYPSQPGAGSNSQSTAWAVQGLLAAGSGSVQVERALAYLRSLTAADGHIRYSRASDQTPVWVTGEAMMALARRPLPLAPVAAPIRSRPSTPAHRAVHRRQRAGHRVRRARRQPRRAAVAVPRRASAGELTLATDAGVAAAVALAPIGLG